MKRREVKSKGEKERYKHLNAEFQRIAGRDLKKPSSEIKAKKQRRTTEWEKLEISSRKQRYQQNILHKNGHNKGQKWYRPDRSRRY